MDVQSSHNINHENNNENNIYFDISDIILLYIIINIIFKIISLLKYQILRRGNLLFFHEEFFQKELTCCENALFEMKNNLIMILRKMNKRKLFNDNNKVKKIKVKKERLMKMITIKRLEII